MELDRASRCSLKSDINDAKRGFFNDRGIRPSTSSSLMKEARSCFYTTSLKVSRLSSFLFQHSPRVPPCRQTNFNSIQISLKLQVSRGSRVCQAFQMDFLWPCRHPSSKDHHLVFFRLSSMLFWGTRHPGTLVQTSRWLADVQKQWNSPWSYTGSCL